MSQADTESTWGSEDGLDEDNAITLPSLPSVPSVPDDASLTENEGETGDKKSDIEEAIVPYTSGFKVRRVLDRVGEGLD